MVAKLSRGFLEGFKSHMLTNTALVNEMPLESLKFFLLLEEKKVSLKKFLTKFPA